MQFSFEVEAKFVFWKKKSIENGFFANKMTRRGPIAIVDSLVKSNCNRKGLQWKKNGFLV